MRRTGGHLVVKTLRELGVRTVFALPGGQTLAIHHALIGVPDLRVVTVRDERSAASMADAVGRLTGAPGVCLATTGPGATNLLTGVGGAYRDSSPVLVLTCNNKLPDLGRDDGQAADHVAIFRPLTKWATLVTEAASIPRVLREAASRATQGCPGPVLVDLARTALEEQLDPGDEPGGIEPATVSRITVTDRRPAATPTEVAAAADALRDARSPLLWLGNGAQLSQAQPEALQLAERLSMPVVTTFNGLGTVPLSHANVLGPLSRMGTSLSRAALPDADLLLAVGNSLNGVSTSRWTVDLPDRILQIDIDPAYLGRNYPDRTLGVLGDARVVLRQLLDALPPPEPGDQPHAARARRLGTLQRAKAAWIRQVAEAADLDTSPIDPLTLVRTIREAMAPEGILVVDAGNAGVWTHTSGRCASQAPI